MALDTRNAFNPKSSPFTMSGNEYELPPLHSMHPSLQAHERWHFSHQHFQPLANHTPHVTIHLPSLVVKSPSVSPQHAGR